MTERMATVTVLRCAGCEAHTKRVAELEALVKDLKFHIMQLLAANMSIKRRVSEALNVEDK